MAIFERMSDLVRANVNDLIDKAENPEKMVKQSTPPRSCWPDNLYRLLQRNGRIFFFVSEICPTA